ncbi:hypothetical protein [Paracerasibacillus soli]|uniref:Uncharacterized protein n=1 Tax=Paracerasibacillus soli TaxID=480284 RepID=A0ABU5CUN7_9BACI|nr:hypothetical protein [Virgibacillus soli]MDY0410088.1 hypothetical protein [Virgibacillus soli]
MRLYPHEVIEYMIAGGMILFLLIIAAILYWGKKLKFGFYISTVVLIGVITFFIIRPFWIEHQINKKSIALEEYLQAQYPDTTWTISAINFRGNKTQNPYYLLVEFWMTLAISIIIMYIKMGRQSRWAEKVAGPFYLIKSIMNRMRMYPIHKVIAYKTHTSIFVDKSI